MNIFCWGCGGEEEDEGEWELSFEHKSDFDYLFQLGALNTCASLSTSRRNTHRNEELCSLYSDRVFPVNHDDDATTPVIVVCRPRPCRRSVV